MAAMLPAATYQVPGDAATIQGGIDMATFGDTVIIGLGEFSGPGNQDLDLGGKRLLITSLYGPQGTVIKPISTGYGDYRAFDIDPNDGPNTVIENLAIVQGKANKGGAIYISRSSLTIRNCHFIENRGSIGGAIYATGESTPRIIDCRFIDNYCNNVGCAVLVRRDADAIIEGCHFEGNYGSHGALLLYDADPSVSKTVFINNSINHNGGAVFMQDNCSPTFDDCLFASNSAGGQGGAIYIDERGKAGGSSEPIFTNCTFYDNNCGRGACIYNDGHGGPAIPVFTNCIIAFNTGDEAIDNVVPDSGISILECSDIYGNPEGDWNDEIADQAHINGNFSADPQFCAADIGDFTLSGTSPCAPANNSCGILIGVYDVGCQIYAKIIITPQPFHSFQADAMDLLMATMYLGCLEDGHQPGDIVSSTVRINEDIVPVTAEIVQYALYFAGGGLKAIFPVGSLIDQYGTIWDTTVQPLSVTGQYSDQSSFAFSTLVTVIGHLSGDANGDGIIDIGDPVCLLNYIFRGGRPPRPYLAGDANGDGKVNIGDAVFMVDYIFRDGNPPVAPGSLSD
jgi:predicted outer membrane repeat protein